MKLSLKKTGPWWLIPIAIGVVVTLFFVLFADFGPTRDFLYTAF